MENPRQTKLAEEIKIKARMLFPSGHFATQENHDRFNAFLLQKFNITKKQFGRGSEDNWRNDGLGPVRHTITILLRAANEQFPVSDEIVVTGMSHAAFTDAVNEEAPLMPDNSRSP